MKDSILRHSFGFHFKSTVECLELCKLIEHCFEVVFPHLFELYRQDRLHGHDHVWNVLEWSLKISWIAQRYHCKDSFQIDYQNLIAASLLHDTAGLEVMSAKRNDHHIRAAEYLTPILKCCSRFKPRFFNIEKVRRIARCHRLRREFPPETLSEEIIALADGLDENMYRLYLGNKKIRPFFDRNLPMQHRLKVVFRKIIAGEGIEREDPRNDALMFMLDSVVRNSFDYNPWKMVLPHEFHDRLRITDECWKETAKDYFQSNYRQLVEYIECEKLPYLKNFIHEFLDQVSKRKGYEFLRNYKW